MDITFRWNRLAIHNLENFTMNLKMRIIKVIGLSRFSPHWMKVFCLQMTMNHIQKQVTNLFKDADLSKLTPEQKMSIQDCVDKMNLARGKGMQA